MKDLPDDHDHDHEPSTDVVEELSWGFCPPELLERILFYVCTRTNSTNEFKNRGAILLVNRIWYICGLRWVYASPELHTDNIINFASTISKPHSPIGDLVRRLDLRRITHGTKNSSSSRLIRKCSRNMEAFYAPQRGLGFSALRSIGSCLNLRYLELSTVSETIELKYLCEAIEKLDQLESVSLPKHSILSAETTVRWPLALQHIGLSGGIGDRFLTEPAIPQSVTSISFTHLPNITLEGFYSLLDKIGPQLKRLRVEYPMRLLPQDGLDLVLLKCPDLESLAVYVDYISSQMFRNIPESHPLRILTMESSGGLFSTKIRPDDVTDAILNNCLPRLRSLRFNIKLGWRKESSDVKDLVELLEDQRGELFQSVY